MQNLLQQNGATPNKQPKYTPIFFDRMFTGLYTQRNVLHDPADIVTSRFYGGRQDALWDGSNVELTNNLTLKRRPGLSPFSTATYPTPPDRAFSFQLTDGTIRVIIDTSSTASLALESVGTAGGGVAIYDFLTPVSCAANNSFVGLSFQIEGFDIGGNNGTFTVIGSTSASLSVNNSNAATETHSGTAISAGAVYWDQQNGSKVLLFVKSPGAGQSYFVAVAGILYVGDGVETWQYSPLVNSGTVANGIAGFGTVSGFGITGPVNPPTVSIVPSGSSATPWVANTVFSTMGLLLDPNGNAQQLFSVNGLGTNPPPATLGTSGNGAPPFNIASVGATTVDGGVTWTNIGPITLWTANTVFQPDQCIYDPTTNALFIMSHNAARTSGAAKPAFNVSNIMNPNSGAHIDDTNNAGIGGGNARWECVGIVNGTPTGVLIWKKNTHFNQWVLASSGFDPGNDNSAIVFPLIPNLANMEAYANGTGPAIYLLAATTAGTTANINYTPWSGIPATGPGSQVAGSVTLDNELEWLCLGSATWSPSEQVSQWTVSGAPLTAVYDSITQTFQVCTTGGQTGTVVPAFKASYGGVTTEAGGSGVQWTCVGGWGKYPSNFPWQVSTQWQLPIVGFVPPSLAQPFGGSEVVGDNFVQAVIDSGLSGSSQPNWQTGLTKLTIDDQITWEVVAQFSQFSLAWQFGLAYAYSYESRLATDFYNTNPPPGLQNTYPNGLGPPTGDQSGSISTASPAFIITGSDSGAVNTISGIGSANPAIDTIVIWRSADGGGVDNMFFLTEIPNPPPIAGVAQPWSFADYLSSTPVTIGSITFPGLNNLIPAPIDEINNPAPSNFLPMVYNFQRIWGAVGSSILFSGGPDSLAGNPNVNFSLSDSFPFLAPVVRAVKTAQGLVVFLTDSIQFIGGGPTLASFFSVDLAAGIGLLSYNFLDIYGGEIYFLSADSQVKVLSPSLTLSNAGFPIGDKIANYNPATGYLAVQQSGTDNNFFLADGSTGWFKCNPRQIPGSPSAGPEPIWSPFANITNGCRLVQSVETAPGIKKLLVGGTGCNQQILERNLNIYQDNGTSYDAFFVMGSIVLCHQGQQALLHHVAADFSGVGYQPTMATMLDEINSPQGTGVFTNLLNPVQDPPQLYGTTLEAQSYSPNRWYFASTGSLARCRHLQLRVDFGTTPNPDEIFNVCIFGRLTVEL